MDTTQKPSSNLSYLTGIFSILVCIIAITGYIYFSIQKANIKHVKGEDLSAVADLKVNQIVNWRKERLGDAQVIFENPLISTQAQLLLRIPSMVRLKEGMISWMQSLCQNYDYENVFLMDDTGRVMLTVGKQNEIIETYPRELAAQAVKERKVIISDLYKDEAGDINIDTLVPLFTKESGDTETLAGILVLRINPRRFLFPLMQKWPSGSFSTSETLLVRREGDTVLFLNELKYKKNAALSLSLPLDKTELPAVKAVTGFEGVTEGRDYRGAGVLAAMRSIPGTSWHLIAKVDTEEVYASIHRDAAGVISAVLLFIILAGLGVRYVWYRQNAIFYREQYESELAQKALAKHYDYLTKYANDIILLLTGTLKIIDVNDRAVAVYGYSRDEFLTMTLNDLRAGDERAKIDMHLQALDKQGGLIYETVHRRKDGTLVPVEASARVLEIEGKRFYQGIVRDISERKEADEKLRKSEEMFRLISENVADMIGVLDTNGRRIYNSPSYRSLLGSVGRLEGTDSFTEIHPVDQERVRRAFAAMVNTGNGQRLEYRILAADGTARFIESIGSVVKDRDGRPFRVVNVSRDITERRAAEERLRNSEERYRNVVDNARDVIYTISPDGMITSLNPAFEKITGWSTAEVIGKLFVGLVHPDDVKPAIGHFQRTLRGETTPPFEMRFLMKNGDYRLAEIKVAPPVVANGKIVGIQGIISDITERKRMEESLQASRDYLDKIINSIADPIFVKDRRHCWVLVNDAFCGFIGHGREELLGKSDPDFFPADQVAVFRKKDELVFTTGEEDVNEEQITNADGEIHYIVTKKTLYSDPDGDKFLVGIIRDTSKDKKIQEELRLNYDLQATINGILRASYDNAGITEMLEKVIEQLLTVSWLGLETHGAIFLIENDPHLLVLKAQKGLPELAQAPFNAVPIEKCTCAGTASASGVFADALEGCEQFHYPGIQCNGHYCVPIIVGDKVIGVLNLFLKEHRQRSDRVVEFLHTISTVIGGVIHRKRAEKEKEKFQAQIIQSSKMAAVGQLAAGVAHELNNPLTIIMGNAQFLMNNSACDAPTREIMSEIESASQRCKKIIADLLNFSRMKELQFNLVDINQLVDHVLHLVEYQSDYKNIAVQKSYAAALPQIMVSASHIEQVFLNIVLNAAQAMRNGGSLTITTALSADNKYVNVMFADSGEGVSQEKLSKIFEPFFTTKPKGTGLGLAVSYSIVRQHGGDIKVSSKGAGQGTTFTISFPLKPPS